MVLLPLSHPTPPQRLSARTHARERHTPSEMLVLHLMQSTTRNNNDALARLHRRRRRLAG